MVKPGFSTTAFLALSSLSISGINSQTPASVTRFSSDLTYSGLYKIYNCNSRLPARLHPEAKQLQQFLPEVWNSTALLVNDILNGTNSKYGFGALFKTNTSIDTVRNTIRYMKYGPDVAPSNEVPTFVCLDSASTDPQLRSLYQQICVQNTIVTAIPHSSWVGFCPSFFELNRRGFTFPISLDCPRTKENTVQDPPHPLMHNLYPLFLAQMLHLHMQSGFIPGDPENQVHHTQDCVSLNATASLSNIANWAIYAACEFFKNYNPSRL